MRSQTCGLLTKNVVLTQRYPKHAVLKVPIATATATNSTFAQHIFIDLATFHCNLTPHLIVVAPHPRQSYLQISPFSSKIPFLGRTAQIHFFRWAKNTRFSTPQNSTYSYRLRKTSFYDLQIPDSSDTQFCDIAKLGEL